MQTLYWILSIIVLIPSLYASAKWIAKRTATKKDDDILDEIKAR